MIDRSILRNVWLLAACQGMLLCNGVTLIAVNGLVGRQLAPTPTLATLTITGYVIGAALMTLPASQFMRRFGRRAGFMLGAVLGICGGLLCAYAVHVGSFWLLCLGTFTSGSYNAFGLQYRFAAADMAPADWKPKAISYTLAGGIIGGFIGPAARAPPAAATAATSSREMNATRPSPALPMLLPVVMAMAAWFSASTEPMASDSPLNACGCRPNRLSAPAVCAPVYSLNDSPLRTPRSAIAALYLGQRRSWVKSSVRTISSSTAAVTTRAVGAVRWM